MGKGKAIGVFVVGLAVVALLYYWLFAYSLALGALVAATAVIYLVVKYIVWFARRAQCSRATRMRNLHDEDI